MLVSFIIPLYNCLDHTREALRTLAASLPAALAHEIILVDDGSTDGTRAWLQTLYPPHRVVLNERNLGYAAANNRGATLARGEFLVLLNNDLVFAPGWLEPMLAAQARLGVRAGCIGNLQYATGDGRLDHAGIVINHRGKPEHDRAWRPWLTRLRLVPAVTGACLLVRREDFLESGGFDENFRNGGEDVDLCFRLRARGRFNAVALRSRVSHHVSASPGRKRHDEANSRRLAAKWRQELVCLGCQAWSWHALEHSWSSSRDPVGWDSAARLLAYVMHLAKHPPAEALAGMQNVMDEEFSRWEALEGKLNAPLPAPPTAGAG